MTDYSIQHTPERNTITATGDHPEHDEGDMIGSQIEGHTTFSFQPIQDCTQEQLMRYIERVLDQKEITYRRQPDEPYYIVVSERDEYSYYHLAVQGNDEISLFVRTATTENSVEQFHTELDNTSSTSWEVEKRETDLTGSGPNRS